MARFAPASARRAKRSRSCSSNLRQRLRNLTLGRHTHHVPGQSESLERADRESGQVELPSPQPVKGRGGEGVVVVVPRLSQRQRGQPQQVARLVSGGEPPPAEEVTQRV